jgi:hypothetical protein
MITFFFALVLPCRMEEALEYQATWGAFALQTKVFDHPLALGTQALRHLLQDLRESVKAIKNKQKIKYDNLTEPSRDKAKL